MSSTRCNPQPFWKNHTTKQKFTCLRLFCHPKAHCCNQETWLSNFRTDCCLFIHVPKATECGSVAAIIFSNPELSRYSWNGSLNCNIPSLLILLWVAAQDGSRSWGTRQRPDHLWATLFHKVFRDTTHYLDLTDKWCICRLCFSKAIITKAECSLAQCLGHIDSQLSCHMIGPNNHYITLPHRSTCYLGLGQKGQLWHYLWREHFNDFYFKRLCNFSGVYIYQNNWLSLITQTFFSSEKACASSGESSGIGNKS